MVRFPFNLVQSRMPVSGRNARFEPDLIFQRTVDILKKWRLAPGHSLRKRCFGPALTTLVLGLGLGLDLHSSC